MIVNPLYKALFIGFLPILIFIIVEELYGTVAGIWAAIVLGVIEFLFIYIREKRVEKLIVFDILLVSFLGGISLLFNDDIFFKLKPAIFELFFLIIIGLSIWTPASIMQMIMKRQLRNTPVDFSKVEEHLKKTLKLFFVILSIHCVVTVFAAIYLSSSQWGFVSGPMLYIFFGILFLYQIIKKRYL